jgi:hypothetical protein
MSSPPIRRIGFKKIGLQILIFLVPEKFSPHKNRSVFLMCFDFRVLDIALRVVAHELSANPRSYAVDQTLSVCFITKWASHVNPGQKIMSLFLDAVFLDICLYCFDFLVAHREKVAATLTTA